MDMRLSEVRVPTIPRSMKDNLRCLGIDHQVAWVRVAVKETVVEHLLDDSAHKGSGKQRAVYTCSIERFDISDLDAADKFLRHDLARRQFTINSWHMHIWEDFHILGQHATVKGLIGVVEFAQYVVGIFINDAVDVGIARPS